MRANNVWSAIAIGGVFVVSSLLSFGCGNPEEPQITNVRLSFWDSIPPDPEDPDWLDQVKALTYGGQGADHAVECSGAAFYQERCMDATRVYGNVNFSGHIPDEKLDFVALDRVTRVGMEAPAQAYIRAMIRPWTSGRTRPTAKNGTPDGATWLGSVKDVPIYWLGIRALTTLWKSMPVTSRRASAS